MNLNKYTKAELISKLKINKNKEGTPNLKISSIIKSYFSQIWNLIVTFKSILLKITLVGLLINFIKKYRIFRIMWSTLTGIVMTIFGISTIDSFGITPFIDEIKSITYNIVNYFSNTSFYNYLRELYGIKTPGINPENNYEPVKNVDNKEIIKTKIIEKIEDQKPDSLRDRYNKSSIADWLKPKVDENYRYPPDATIIHSEKELTESWYNWKYILIAGIVITTGCLGYVYFDEIKEGGAAFIEWIFSRRPGGGSNPGNNNSNDPIIPTNNSGNINPKDSPDSLDIELVNKNNLNERMASLFKSPSLDELNERAKESFNSGSVSPSSSTETIKASSSKVKLDSPFPLTDSSFNPNIESKIKVETLMEKVSELKDKLFGDINEDNFRNYIENADIRHNIEYIETHLPKSELNDTTYIENLMTQVKIYTHESIEFLKDNYDNLDAKEIGTRNGVIHEIAEWIKKMSKEISKFD